MAESVHEDAGRLSLGRTRRLDLTACTVSSSTISGTRDAFCMLMELLFFLAGGGVPSARIEPGWHDDFGRDLAGRRAWQNRLS